MAISYKNTGSSEHENEEVKTTGGLLAPPIMPGHHAAQTA